jgi:nicotinamidase/pyrazinamidase
MDALIVVDVQNDFLPGGALAVPEGDKVVPVINRLMERFDMVVATQDWHPSDHESFAARHPGKSVGDAIELHGLEQILWPDHCVQNSPGASFASGLDVAPFQAVFRKGMDREIDSYSGFFDNGHRRDTGLNDYLKQQGVTDVYVTGLAADFCVKFTARDAASLGYRTHLYAPATRAVNLQPGDFEKTLAELRSLGVTILESV